MHWPYFDKPMRAATYDRDGNLLSEKVLSYEEGVEVYPTWEVPVRRLPLYSAPDTSAVTRGYLIAGDETAMLAFKGDEWMKIAYEGKRGRIERWVSLKDAYDLAARYDPDLEPPAPLALWALDYSEAQDDPNFYRNLFTLFIDNIGSEDIDIHAGEIHLIFTASDNTSSSQRLYSLWTDTLTLVPGQSRILDDNPIEQHGDRYVIFHAPAEGEYVPFFPPDLQPGTYQVRPVLTSPHLPEPVYAVSTFQINYPPKLPPELIKP